MIDTPRSSAEILAELDALKAAPPTTGSAAEAKASLDSLVNLAVVHGRSGDQIAQVVARVQASPSDAAKIGALTGLPNLCLAAAQVVLAGGAHEDHAAQITSLEHELVSAVEAEDAAEKAAAAQVVAATKKAKAPPAQSAVLSPGSIQGA